MYLKINITGFGEVFGEGTYRVGDVANLEATTDGLLSFGYFRVESLDYEGDSNPNPKIYSPKYSILIEKDEDMFVEAYFYMTMEEYLRATFDFDISQNVLVKIALDHKYNLADDSNTISEKDKDLSIADLLFVMCNTPSTYMGATEKAGEFSKTQASKTLTSSDKIRMYNQAVGLYEKWGLKAPAENRSFVKMMRGFW